MTAFGLQNANTNTNNTSRVDQILNSLPSDNTNPWIAAGEGNLQLLQQILTQQNLSINEQDENGYSFLHSASSYNQIPTVQWLLSQSQPHQQTINVNIQDTDGDTPLHHCEYVDAARCLIEVGNVDFRIKNNEGKNALQVKEEELEEGQDHEDDDSPEILELRRLVEYLSDVMMSC